MNEEEAKRILMELSTFDYVKLENGDVAIETVLNLIEKQQAEIEDWKTDYNHRCQLAIDRKIEIEKKDKIIDLMAKDIKEAEYKIKEDK